jgi:2-polyprenyl-6-methoxyphenol hydroxylase-like FAD-dependent oxidoreductase
MGSKTYDIITVGGGLGGSALAKAMAEHGVWVLVVERERRFKDRVRGEAMHPWGVAEVRTLGIYELLHEACGHEIPWRDTYLGPERIIHRDLSATTPQRAAEFFVGAKGLGPLATFSGADTWVEHPYRQGVVLIGDAAASDPSFGQGLALTVRDVRVLRDALVS